jgi:hypothetical protein
MSDSTPSTYRLRTGSAPVPARERSLMAIRWRVLALLLLAVQVGGASGTEPARVDVTITAPADMASIADHALEIRLYAIEPLLADAPASLVDMREQPFSHTTGRPTRVAVRLGEAAPLEPQLRYYVTVFVLRDGARTHIGERDGKPGLIHVLTDGHPAELEAVLRPVR